MILRPACINIVFLLLYCWALPIHAHKPSDSYLTLSVKGAAINVQWDIALRDLEYAIGLDSDGDGNITWGELRTKHGDIAGYALARLRLLNDGNACQPGKTNLLLDHHTDGAYAVLRFHAECNRDINALEVQYNLLFDVDPQHKGLLKIVGHELTSTAIFSPDNARRRFIIGQQSELQQFTEYVKHGVWHIWIGFDHILFLISLLLPAVLIFRKQQWNPADSFKAASMDALKIITAFTLAHSLTLTLATLGVVSLPSRGVESVIAASVVIAAVNNLFPIFQGRRWIAAFIFGLVHGFGFASVLSDLGLPQSSLLLALIGFNVGVEIGQLVIVTAFLPIGYLLRQTWLYQRLLFTGGSSLIALIAIIWLIERTFDLKLIAV